MEPFQFHPSIVQVLQFFDFRHLPPDLTTVSRPFAQLAMDLATRMDSSPELTVALRKLLEAKDAAVRAANGDGSSALAVACSLQSALSHDE